MATPAAVLQNFQDLVLILQGDELVCATTWKKTVKNKEADWKELDDLEDNLALAEEYLGQRDKGAFVPPGKLEPNARRGLKRCAGVLKARIQRNRTFLSDAVPRLTRLSNEVAAAKRETANALKVMAAGHLNRVGAPKLNLHDPGMGKECEDLMKGVVELGAPASAFNALYEALRSDQHPEWTCTEADAALPERDLLGMCPGGKPHLNEEQLKARKATYCYCSMCVAQRKLSELEGQLARLKPDVDRSRDQLRTDQKWNRETRWIINRLRSDGAEEDEGGSSDPVFYDEPFEASEEETVAHKSHRQAQQTWEMLQKTLDVSDFPLRLVFLDKSGSMGCDSVTYDALQLGLHNCLYPESGSTLSFLFAGPGETQIFFRRPGDAPISVEIDLGCATWFNEPILRTLKMVAPLVEQLNTKEWMKNFGQPPLQVLCMTDGADNCSPSEIRSLSGLVRELKEIVGPVSEQKLYRPITGSIKKHKDLFEEDNVQVPVWLAWICCGMGGSQMLQSSVPKGICMVDAIAAPQYREPPALKEIQAPEPTHDHQDEDGERLHALTSTVASRARRRVSAACASATGAEWVSSANASWSIGHRVRVRAAAPGKAPKAAMVLHVHQTEGQPPQYELLFDDESRSTVDASQILGAPAKRETLLRLPKGSARPRGLQAQTGVLARTADQDEQRLQVLGVVNSMLQDLAKIMNSKEDKAKTVSLEDAASFASGKGISSSALEEKLKQAQSMVEVAPQEPVLPEDPSAMVMMAMGELGRSAVKLLPEDRLVAQRIVSVGMEMLMSGGSVNPAHTSDQLGPFAGLAEANAVRRIRIEPGEMDAWRNELSQPVQEMLSMMLRKGLLETEQTADGEVWSATQDALPCLAAIWRFVDPSLSSAGQEDALRRAVNRMQRMKPSFSFCTQSSTTDLAVLAGNASSPVASDDNSTPPWRQSRDALPPLSPGSRVSTAGGLPPLSPGSRVSTPDSASKASSSSPKMFCSASKDLTRTSISQGSNRSVSTTASASSSPGGFIRKASGVAKNRTSSLTALGQLALADDSPAMSPSNRPGSARRTRALSQTRRQSTMR